MKRNVKMKRIQEILKSLPEEIELTKNEKIFVTAQIICNVLDYVTKSKERVKFTDLYIMCISYNSPLYTPWAKELFNKISFCQLMAYSGRCEYDHYEVIKKTEGLYIEPK